MTEKSDESTVDERIWRGPLKNRNCTDIPCLLIFVIVILCWLCVGYYALIIGDVNKFLVPTDSKGRKCGIDDDVVDKPVLVFFDLTKCIRDHCDTTQVCQSQCPTKNWIFKPNPIAMNETYNSMLCEDGINVKDKSIDELKQLITSKACAKWYLKSNQVLNRCIPNLIPNDLENATITSENLTKAVLVIEMLQSIHDVVNVTVLTKNEVIVFIFGGMLVCLLYIVLLRWIALPCVWISIIFIVGLLAYLSYLCYHFYIQNGWNGWIILTSVLGAVAIIVTLIAVCLWKKIHLACQLITETSKATAHILSIVFFPILPWLISLSLIIYSIIVALYLMSIEYRKFVIKGELNDGNCQCSSEVNYTIGDSCEPNLFYKYCKEFDGPCFSMNCHLQKVSTPLYMIYLYVFHFVGFLWLFIFIIDLKKIIIAFTYATWYWTFNKAHIPFFIVIASTCRIVRYHLGTVAFGSVIITICRLFRIILEYLHTTANTQLAPDVCATQIKNCLFYCSKCCMFLLEKVLKYLTQNAYIMCAITGKGLCASAAAALSLLMKNILRAGILNRIVDWSLRLGKILIASIMILIAWWYFNQNENEAVREYWYVPVILIGAGSYLVASVFFNVYSIGVETIFLCVLQDCDYNDGSQEKPYYMSRNIGKLLNVQ